MKRKRIAQVFIYLALLIGAVVFILPYVYMLITSTQTNAEIFAPKLNFKPGSHFIDNITYVQETYNYTRILINSIFITVTGTLLSTFMTTLAGYVMAKFNFKGQKLIFNLIVVARMVPSFTLLIPTFYILSKLGLTNTHTGVIVSSLASTTSVFMMRQYAQKFPTELLESGRIDGANEWMIFFRIAVPVLVPSIVTVGLMNFMGYWNS
jgi:ABC-type glycerol-3-phosphate transport system permease component